MESIEINLSESPYYINSLKDWQPLLEKDATSTESSREQIYFHFVDVYLWPNMDHEESGKKILKALQDAGNSREASKLILSKALLTKETTLSLVVKGRLEKFYGYLTSPLIIAITLGVLTVGAIHVLFGIGVSKENELKVVYLSPIINLGVLFFAVPFLLKLLSRWKK